MMMTTTTTTTIAGASCKRALSGVTFTSLLHVINMQTGARNISHMSQQVKVKVLIRIQIPLFNKKREVYKVRKQNYSQ